MLIKGLRAVMICQQMIVSCWPLPNIIKGLRPVVVVQPMHSIILLSFSHI